MQDLLSVVSIQVNDSVYQKNPESSDLGKRILSGSIALLDEIGFEAFTFSKLANQIGSTEASVYRYFESKHKLLLYLTSWYWAWMTYRVVFATTNVESPTERLERAIKLLAEMVEEDGTFSHINEVKLNRIVISESSKSFLTKEVDVENKDGVFADYKKLVERVSGYITEINPEYKYPHMLISTIIESAHLQRFFSEHLPRLTDSVKGEDAITNFCTATVFSAIKK